MLATLSGRGESCYESRTENCRKYMNTFNLCMSEINFKAGWEAMNGGAAMRGRISKREITVPLAAAKVAETRPLQGTGIPHRDRKSLLRLNLLKSGLN